jgi:hypothetical protein
MGLIRVPRFDMQMQTLENRILLDESRKLQMQPICGNVGLSILAKKAELETSPGQIGLIGGKFFTVTYSFLGQVIMGLLLSEFVQISTN